MSSTAISSRAQAGSSEMVVSGISTGGAAHCHSPDDRILDSKLDRIARTLASCSKHYSCAAWQAAVFSSSDSYMSCIIQVKCQQAGTVKNTGPQALRFQVANMSVKSASAGTSLYETPPSSPWSTFLQHQNPGRCSRRLRKLCCAAILVKPRKAAVTLLKCSSLAPA